MSRLSRRTLLLFALPAAPLSVVVFPSYAVLPGFYAAHTAIPLSVIGVILLVARAFDSLVDPVIGHLSDVTARRWGTRKPWLAAGAVVLSACVVPLYGPGEGTGAAAFMACFIGFYLGYSLIEIPYKAWGTELSRAYADRTRIASAIAVAFALGNLAFAAAPLLTPGGGAGYDARTLALIGWGVAVACPLAVLAACLVRRAPPRASARPDMALMVRALRGNGPLRHFLLMFMLTGLGQGVFYGLVFLFVGSRLGLAQAFGWVLLVDALVTLVSIPVWAALIQRWQKHRAWALGLGVSALALLAMLALRPGDLAILLTLVAARAFGSGVTQAAPNALLGDVVDYELLRRGVNPAANFHALVSLSAKLTAALGGGVGLLAVDAAGFEARGANTAEALTALSFATLAAPAAILALGAAVALRFPLDRRRHAVVQRRLERTGR